GATTTAIAAGSSVADAITAGGLVAAAVGVGGVPLATEVMNGVNMISALHGTGADMTRMADALTQAFKSGGADAASAVLDSAAASFGTVMGNQIGGSNIPGGIADVIRTAQAAA